MILMTFNRAVGKRPGFLILEIMDEKELHEAVKRSTLTHNPMSPINKKNIRRTTELVDLNPVDEYRRAWGTYKQINACK